MPLVSWLRSWGRKRTRGLCEIPPSSRHDWRRMRRPQSDYLRGYSGHDTLQSNDDRDTIAGSDLDSK